MQVWYFPTFSFRRLYLSLTLLGANFTLICIVLMASDWETSNWTFLFVLFCFVCKDISTSLLLTAASASVPDGPRHETELNRCFHHYERCLKPAARAHDPSRALPADRHDERRSGSDDGSARKYHVYTSSDKLLLDSDGFKAKRVSAVRR